VAQVGAEMEREKLNIGIIYGTGTPVPDLLALLTNLPRVNVSEQSVDVSEFLLLPGEAAPDTMIVYLDGMTSPPEWIETLTSKFPQVPVLVCSERLEWEFLRRSMQLGVREILPIPLNEVKVQAALERVRFRKRRSEGTSQGRVIAVTGQKGGVGTTTIALNLAVALAELQAERCALVDLGRPFPDIDNFLDQAGTYNLADALNNLDNLDESFFQKIMQPYENNLAILHGIPDFQEQDNLPIEGIERILSILRNLYHHVVVDLGHLFDDVFLQVLKEADLVLILTELNVPNFRNLRKFWPLLKDWDPTRQKIKIVVNRYNRGDDLGLRELRKILEEPPYAFLPSDYHPLHEAINQGVPLAKVAPRSKLHLSLKDVARKVIDSTSLKEKSTNGFRTRRRFWIF
jgi:pilus assembly protein CpaE